MKGGNIIPTLRYRDAAAAIDWLCSAFGFERHMVVSGEAGIIEHAQLIFGNGMIMLGSVRENAFDKLQRPPEHPDAPVNQSPYIVVDDVDVHCARAVKAGAAVAMEPVNEDYGGRFYSCRDPEGYLWNFGTYDPWLEAS